MYICHGTRDGLCFGTMWTLGFGLLLLCSFYIGPSSEVGLRAFQKTQASGWVELLPRPITNPDDRHCDPDTHGDGDKNNDVEWWHLQAQDFWLSTKKGQKSKVNLTLHKVFQNLELIGMLVFCCKGLYYVILVKGYKPITSKLRLKTCMLLIAGFD